MFESRFKIESYRCVYQLIFMLCVLTPVLGANGRALDKKNQCPISLLLIYDGLFIVEPTLSNPFTFISFKLCNL